MIGLGFAVQRIKPLAEGTLAKVARLVVNLLIPLFLFYTTATQTDFRSIRQAPIMVGLGVAISLGNYLLGWVVSELFKVAREQQPVFRFSMMWTNTLFLAVPICGIVFGPQGVVYAVLYDFGSSLVVLSLGLSTLRRDQAEKWQALLQSLFSNVLIWAVLAGLGWALAGWPFPEWLAPPLETLGSVTLPMALFVGGALLGNIRSFQPSSKRNLIGLTFTRLVLAPLLVGLLLSLGKWQGIAAGVTLIEAAMPVGLTASLFAKAYQADAQFVASATFLSTFVSMFTAPLLAVWASQMF